MNRKQSIKAIPYILTGIVVLTGSIATGSWGLSDKDKAIYEMAAEQQDSVNAFGFEGFELADYPVTFFDGDYDYVVQPETDGYSVEKRMPVINTFVGTAYEVDGHYEVIVPTIDKFSEMFDILSAATTAGELSEHSDLSFEKDEYGEKEQVATIWHEAFHAYQMTKAEPQIEEVLAGHAFSEEDLQEGLIVKQVDENEEQRALYEEQMALLKEAVSTSEVDTLKEIIIQYKELEEERTALLSEEVRILEEYYKRFEGSARYVEAMVYRNLYSEEAFQARYIENLDVYQGGSGKYYGIGMAECLILDRLCGDWKAEYDFSESFLDLICAELKIS